MQVCVCVCVVVCISVQVGDLYNDGQAIDEQSMRKSENSKDTSYLYSK